VHLSSINYEVLATSPLTMSLVYMELAKRVGLPMQGV
jgi:regulator of sirC expression with transglutaminase-like and TPR domain